MFNGLLSSAIPLILASEGALLSELSGALAIFIEGFMTLGAFLSFLFAANGIPIFISSILAALILGAFGFAASKIVRALKANPFIVSLAINIFCDAITLIFSESIFASKGTLKTAAINSLSQIEIPLIKNIPFIGGVLSPINSFAFPTLLLVTLIFIFVHHTIFGLRLKAVGMSEIAARERGINSGRYRDYAWAAAALLASLAGAALTFRIGAYTPGGAGGRGWTALAAVFLGGKTVHGVFGAALLFTAAERLVFGSQGFLPTQLSLCIPPLLALAVFALTARVGKG